MSSSAPQKEPKITKADLEQKLRNLQGGVEESVASRRQKIIGSGIAIFVMMMLLAYVIGRRAGHKRSTVVEIRRF